MKRPSDAIEDSVAATASRTSGEHRQQSYISHEHYSYTRRRQSRTTNSPPHVAVHYSPSTPHDGCTSVPLTSLSLLANESQEFPVAFLVSTKMLVIDTGASISISPDRQDFVGNIQSVQPTVLKGIASGLQVQGIGTASYTVIADNGSSVTITLPDTLYVPGCTARLLCPRHLAASTAQHGDGFTAYSDHGVLRCHGSDITVSYHDVSRLPILYSSAPRLSIPDESSSTFHALQATDMATSKHHTSHNTPINLSPSQRLKLLIHERCNHRNMRDINNWLRNGLLSADPSLANTPDPICHVCLLGKSKRKPHAKSTGSITASVGHPGAGVSADQLEAGCPGRIPTMKGLPTTKRYKYCSIWIDHYSKYIYPTFHESKHASELLRSKAEFEVFAGRYGVRIAAIRADNGVYASDAFQSSCDKAQQALTFCAVGGHWQNGVVERYIGVITETARTILLHAASKWPGVVTEEFWPFAIRHACTFHNASVYPGSNKSPHHMFTGSPAPWRMQDFKVFGCPVYVLDKRLQDGDSLSKWKARCWTGIYVGNSLQHAGNVPLVYNIATTHVSPQYHVTFDDTFSTVVGAVAKLSDVDYEKLYNSTDWLFSHAFENSKDLHLFESFWSNPPLSRPAKRQKKAAQTSHRKLRPTSRPVELPTITESSLPVDCHLSCDVSSSTAACHVASVALPDCASSHSVPSTQPIVLFGEHATVLDNHALDSGEHTVISGDHATASGEHATISGDHAIPYGEQATDSSDRRSVSKTYNKKPLPYINLRPVPCSSSLLDFLSLHGLQATVYTAISSTPTSDTSTSPPSHPVDFAPDTTLLSYAFPDIDNSSASVADNKTDILTQGQMFNAPDAVKFIECQKTELEALTDLDIMDILPIETLPLKAKLLSSIWSYRRKRLPNGVFSKYKSRLCVNGKEQAYGRDYWDTYAPVVAWSTIRLLLYLSTILSLQTRQVDYTSAFPQADLDVPVYMKVPQGWHVVEGKLEQHSNPRHTDSKNYVRLKKNLYGCKQAARNWFRLLCDGLKSEGFQQSSTDSCLFI
jgi:hypothetical protein